MKTMGELIRYKMQTSGYTHIDHYINNLSESITIPCILHGDFMMQIIHPGPMPLSFSLQTNELFDQWNQPIIITLTTNKNHKVGLTMHSFGKNKINENGKGDDILIWFNSDMSCPKLGIKPSTKK